MAKSKSKSKGGLGLIFNIIAITLCIVTIISFFIPTFKTKGEEPVSYSSMEICFVSEDKAEEKAKDYTADLNLKLAQKYTVLKEIKANEDCNSAFISAGWIHFGAMLASVVALVFIVMCMLGKKFSGIAKLSLLIALTLMIVSLIMAITFLNAKTSIVTLLLVNKKISEVVSIGTGNIIGLITSMAAFICELLKVKGKNTL